MWLYGSISQPDKSSQQIYGFSTEKSLRTFIKTGIMSGFDIKLNKSIYQTAFLFLRLKDPVMHPLINLNIASSLIKTCLAMVDPYKNLEVLQI